ncbi:hypothetical protein B0H14DRAFT_2638310 [Mycena olivaceomarginata]|nr:hypothetical protein B0H14DRAFT_2638310 [Mycena olivaceomarginata]
MPIQPEPLIEQTFGVHIRIPGVLLHRNLARWQFELHGSHAVFLQFKEELLQTDLRQIDGISQFWPTPMPPQDDTEILWNFVRCFIAWRDSVARKTQNWPPATAEQSVRQMNYIICSEQAHREWKSEVLETWGAYRSVQDSGAKTKDLKKYWRPTPPIRELPPRASTDSTASTSDQFPRRLFQSRRENIQQEWNKIAHDAGATKIEFINEVDMSLSSPKPVPWLDAIVAGRHVAMMRSNVPAELSFRTVVLHSVQGPFMFNTESEVVECNKVLGLYTGRREDANKLSGSRASYCFDLDVNEEPKEDHPVNAYSVDCPVQNFEGNEEYGDLEQADKGATST